MESKTSPNVNCESGCGCGQDICIAASDIASYPVIPPM